MGRGRRTRGIDSLAVVAEPRMIMDGIGVEGEVSGLDLLARAVDRHRDGASGASVDSADKIDAFLETDFEASDVSTRPPNSTPRFVGILLVALAVAAVFVVNRSSPDAGSPVTDPAGAAVPETTVITTADNRIQPADATEIEILHRTLPPDGGLYSVAILVHNRSDIAIPASTLTIEVEALGVRVDPLDVRYDNRLLAAGGTIEAAVRVELPADSDPELIALFDGGEIARVALD